MNTMIEVGSENSSRTPATAVRLDSAGIDEIDTPLQARVEDQVDRFVNDLLRADLHGEDFRERMDSAFKLGRQEIMEATRLNSSFLKQSYRAISDSNAFESMAALRAIMDDLNPGAQGDLMSVNKILGLFPGGTKLKKYLRRFQTAESQILALTAQLSAAQDDLERDVIALDEAKVQLFAALRNLKAAAHFARVLQQRLKEKVDQLRTADPLRAKALEQEALYYAAQSLDGILTQQAVTTNGYLALDPLKKTARELSIGIDRLKTTGSSALAVAQMIAIATGHQVRGQDALARSKDVVAHLVVQTSIQLGNHVQTVGKNASEPLIDITKLQAVFDQTFKALDAMDNFRAQAITSMLKNNEVLQSLIDKAKQHVDRVAPVEGAVKHDQATAGPVAL